MILDQRSMTGPLPLATVEDVKGYWGGYAETRMFLGLEPFPQAPGRRELAQGRKPVVAYISDSRWVADCNGGPTGKCNGGIACWPEHEHGCCLDCGTVYPVSFPEDAERHEIEQALLARPEANRHWHGESAEELRHENIEHGYQPIPSWKTQLAAEQNVSLDQIDAILAAQPKRGRR